MMLIVITCFMDDVKGLGPVPKANCTNFGSLCSVVSSGTRIDILNIEFFRKFSDSVNFLNTVSTIITICWIVGLTNAINLIDGLDGLSSGISIISCVSMLVCICFKWITYF